MGQAESNESAAVKRQAEGFSNPMYRMLDLGGGGLFMELGKRAEVGPAALDPETWSRCHIRFGDPLFYFHQWLVAIQ